MPKKKFRTLTDSEIKYVISTYRQDSAEEIVSNLERDGGGPLSKTQIYAVVRRYRLEIENALTRAKNEGNTDLIAKLESHKTHFFPQKRRNANQTLSLSDLIDDLDQIESAITKHLSQNDESQIVQLKLLTK